MSELAKKFSVGINTIIKRIDYFHIEKRKRGGANNQKVEIDQSLLDDIVKVGVHAAAAKRGIKPQTLYQRLYYKHGTTVKKVKEAVAALSAAQTTPSSAEHEDVPPSSVESLPEVHGDK